MDRTTRGLSDFGLDATNVRSFVESGVAVLEGPNGSEIIFRDGDRLVSQLFFVSSDGVSGRGLASINDFTSRSRELARSLGFSTVEIQGGTVTNDRLRQILLRRGFEEAEIFNPFFGEAQNVLRRIEEVR